MTISAYQLMQIMPHAGTRAELYAPWINEACERFGIDTPIRQAAFLSQIAHESGHLRYVRELASGMAYDFRADLGNVKPEAIAIAAAHQSTPGVWWKGRGLIQITGYLNYQACGAALGVELLHNPFALETPRYAALSAGWFWHANAINVRADALDFDGVCDLVNRGRKTARMGDALGFPDRLAAYERAKEVLA